MRNWKYTINIAPFLSDSEEPEIVKAEANAIANEVKKLIYINPSYLHLDQYDLNQLMDLVEYLTDCDDIDEVNYLLNELYDFGDAHSIWINTFGIS